MTNDEELLSELRAEVAEIAPDQRQAFLAKRLAALPDVTPLMRNRIATEFVPATEGKRPKAALNIDQRQMLDRYAALSDSDFMRLPASTRMLFADLGGVREAKAAKIITRDEAAATLELEIARLSAERKAADAEADAGRGSYEKGNALFARELAAQKQLRELNSDMPKPDAY